MIMLIPLYRYSVDYEVGSGQPYSALHSLIMRAIAESEGISISALGELFRLPSRLLIEVLLVLFKEGWIAVSMRTGGGFNITQQGAEALKDNKTPQTFQIEAKHGAILMERVTGLLIPQGELRYHESKRELVRKGVWEIAHALEPEYFDVRLDEGQVQNLLRRDRRQWIRHIQQPILTHDCYYLPVDIAFDRQQPYVTGLPERWKEHLEPVLADVAEMIVRDNPSLPDRSYWGGKAPAGMERSLETVWRVELTEEDLILRASDHSAQLERALREARTILFISSASCDPAFALSQIRSRLRTAEPRSINVDLMWGETIGAQTRGGCDAIAALQGEQGPADAPGGLRITASQVSSSVNMLIYDTGEGLTGYIGTYSWLAAPLENIRGGAAAVSHISVRLRHPGILAEACRSAAAFMRESLRQNMTPSPDRWRKTAESLDQQAVMSNSADDGDNGSSIYCCDVQLIRDQKHASLLSECLLSAQSRCAVLSSRIGDSARSRLAAVGSRLRSRSEPAELRIKFGESVDLSPEDLSELSRYVEAGGGSLSRRHGLSANAVVADTTAVLSGYDFLYNRTDSRSITKRALGVLIDGGIIADVIWEKFIRPDD